MSKIRNQIRERRYLDHMLKSGFSEPFPRDICTVGQRSGMSHISVQEPIPVGPGPYGAMTEEQVIRTLEPLYDRNLGLFMIDNEKLHISKDLEEFYVELIKSLQYT